MSYGMPALSSRMPKNSPARPAPEIRTRGGWSAVELGVGVGASVRVVILEESRRQLRERGEKGVRKGKMKIGSNGMRGMEEGKGDDERDDEQTKILSFTLSSVVFFDSSLLPLFFSAMVTRYVYF